MNCLKFLFCESSKQKENASAKFHKGETSLFYDTIKTATLKLATTANEVGDRGGSLPFTSSLPTTMFGKLKLNPPLVDQQKSRSTESLIHDPSRDKVPIHRSSSVRREKKTVKSSPNPALNTAFWKSPE